MYQIVSPIVSFFFLIDVETLHPTYARHSEDAEYVFTEWMNTCMCA